MKINELRIGNLLIYKEEIIDVDNIINSEINYNVDYGSGIDFIELKPIQLTEEILLKCGFSYNKENTLLIHKDCGLMLMDIVGLYYRANFPIKADIKYLHQLQNLYFSLTNKELEIKI